MKKPRKTIATAAKAQNRSPDTLEKTAEEQVAAGRWREAIAAYKDLIKLTDSPEARVGLAGAYAGRARELVAKGMPKEALTIWENRAQLLPDLPLELGHLALLLRLGRVAQVVELYIREAARLDAETLTALRSHLAAYHLGADPAVAAGLPADDPILVQGGVASQALDAYCRGDDVTLRTALAGISFRSPYRDLAQILKALQRLPVAPAEAATALDKVGDDSGFARLRHACVLALGVPESLTEDLAAGRRSDPALRLDAGWLGERRRALWDEVRRMTDQGARTLVHLLHRRRALFGEDWARTQALRLLTPGFPKSAVWVSEGGGRRLSTAERLLVAARHCEDGRDPWAEIEAWADYVDHLIQDGPPEPGSDAAVCIALVLRRVDSHRNILAAVSPSSAPGCLGPLSGQVGGGQPRLRPGPPGTPTCAWLVTTCAARTSSPPGACWTGACSASPGTWGCSPRPWTSPWPAMPLKRRRAMPATSWPWTPSTAARANVWSRPTWLMPASRYDPLGGTWRPRSWTLPPTGTPPGASASSATCSSACWS